MLTKGFNTNVFVIKRMRTALKITTKGVVSTFLTPGGPSLSTL